MEADPMPGRWWPGAGAADARDGPQAPNQEANQEANQGPQQPSPEEQQRRRRYGPRTCRICLEVVQPTFPEGLRVTLLGRNPRPTYISDDPELGRLMSPCKCKGSQKYVHEGCLQAWREAAPLRDRNFFQCPTCRFKYRLERMSWARYVSSEASQLALTLVIVLLLVFILGFAADTIFDLWLDPYSTIADSFSGAEHEFVEEVVEPGGWLEHFLKGFFSLGIVGMFKALWAMNPWNWYNIRSSGLLSAGRGRRPGSTGRGRMEDISWTVVIIGTITAIYTLWKGVRFVSRRTLLAASNNVLDVGGEDDEEEEEEEARPHED